MNKCAGLSHILVRYQLRYKVISVPIPNDDRLGLYVSWILNGARRNTRTKIERKYREEIERLTERSRKIGLIGVALFVALATSLSLLVSSSHILLIFLLIPVALIIRINWKINKLNEEFLVLMNSRYKSPEERLLDISI